MPVLVLSLILFLTIWGAWFTSLPIHGEIGRRSLPAMFKISTSS